MCNKAVKKCPWVLDLIPDHYVRLQEMWCKDYSYIVVPRPWGYDDDNLIEWHKGYK